MKFNYYVDKETNNTFRFQPDTLAARTLGQATIYIRKDALQSLGCADPKDGLTIEISCTKTDGGAE